MLRRNCSSGTVPIATDRPTAINGVLRIVLATTYLSHAVSGHLTYSTNVSIQLGKDCKLTQTYPNPNWINHLFSERISIPQHGALLCGGRFTVTAHGPVCRIVYVGTSAYQGHSFRFGCKQEFP